MSNRCLESNFVLDNNSNLSYEKMGAFGNFLNKILIQIFKYAPNVSKKIFLKSSNDAKIVFDNVTTSKALEVLYSYQISDIFQKGNLLNKIFNFIWHHLIANAKGVRNRYKLVRRELIKAVENLSLDKKRKIKMLSIASGSARVDIEVMKFFQERHKSIEAKLLDLSKDALNLSQKIIKENNLLNSISFCHDKASNFYKYCQGWEPNIIEMVGFMDYLSKEKAINLVTSIYKNLSTGGFFITANIMKNSEELIFMSKILKWDMVYRSKEELLEILLRSGFKNKNCVIYIEPTLIHAVAIAQK